MATVDNAGTAADDLVGRDVAGRYRVVRRIAAGGMGVVYEATQQPLGRRVALKVIRGSTFDAVTRVRFEREARAAAALHDPHVVVVYDFGVVDEADGGMFLAMEFVVGETLRARLGRLGRLSWRDSLSVVTQVARALAAAHAARLVHRDLKPENVMVTAADASRDDAHCKVLDFGLAKSVDNHLLSSGDRHLTNSGSFVGTPGYISPEILNGDDEHPRQDIYALGVMWWELLCGRHPFDAPTPMKTLVRQMHEEPPPLDGAMCPPGEVPDDGALLLRAMMARDPLHRPLDGRDLLQRLAQLPSMSTPPRPTPPDAVTIGDVDAVAARALRAGAHTPSAAAHHTRALLLPSPTTATPLPVSLPPAAAANPAAVSSMTPSSTTPSSTMASSTTPSSTTNRTTTGSGAPVARPWLWLVGGATLSAAITTAIPALLSDDEQAPPTTPLPPSVEASTGIARTEVVVDGLPAYGLVRSLRALLPVAGSVRRFKTAHLELVLDGDHADAIYDALQGHVLSADGHAVQLVIDESEPGRVALHAVSLDDAGVEGGTASTPDAQRVPLFDEPSADAGSAVDAAPNAGSNAGSNVGPDVGPNGGSTGAVDAGSVAGGAPAAIPDGAAPTADGAGGNDAGAAASDAAR
jgi:serine/threonine-protein kinase